MADLIQISLEETGNLLSSKSLLKDNPTISYIGNTGIGTITKERIVNPDCFSYKMYEVQNVITGLNTQFSFGDALQYTAVREGNHTFSFFISKGNINADTDYNVDVLLKLYVNSVLIETYTKNLPLINDGIDFRFAQSFNLNEGDDVNFAFEVNKASVGTPNPNIELYFTCFQLNYGNVSDYNIPIEQKTGWQSKVDTINTQALTANTDNLIAFTGTDSSNGCLTLMNSVGKITPIKNGDSIIVDFAFSFPSPSGTTDYLSVKLKVNGVVYRTQSFNILEPTGETNYIAVSFCLPVEADFYTYGGEFFVNPNVAITISNRYLQVTRTHKGI